jgi:hypothetical protein
MKTELYINGNLVDITDGIPIPLTYQITDITEPDKRKGNRSKTITLPGTQKNMNIFHTCFDVRLTDGTSGVVNFDPSKKAPVRLYYGGLLQFEGVCSIKQCNLKNKIWSFDIYMFSDFMNYMDELKKIKLASLGWDDYLHDLTTANIEDSWDGTIQYQGSPASNAVGTNWDGIGYYYGLVDYGSRTVSDEWDLEDMVPQVFVYDIIQRMFTQIGVTVNSDFFDSQRFKRMMLAWEGGQLPLIDNDEANDSSIYTAQKTGVSLATFNTQLYSLGSFIVNAYAGSVIQDINSQTQQTDPYLATLSEDGIYKVTFNADYDFDYTSVTGSWANFETRARVSIQVVIDNVSVETIEIYNEIHTLNGAGVQTVNAVFSYENEFVIDSQSQIKFFLIFGAQFVSSTDVIQQLQLQELEVNINSGTLDIVRDPVAHVAGQDVKIKYFMPKMTCDTFFKGIMTMFNLYLEVDPVDATQIYIEPLIDFYDGTDNAIQMTHKLDYSDTVEVIPTPSVAAKAYNWKWKENKDLNNEIYLEQTLGQYGGRELPSNVDFATSEVNYTVPFACVPIAELGTLILPRVVQEKGGQDVRYKGNPFIVQLGQSPLESDRRLGDWKLNETVGSPPYSQTTYTRQPYVGHISDPDNPFSSTTFDLTFKVPEYVFYQATGYTTRNLYGFHERFVKEIVDRFGKMLRARFNLNADDINKLDFGVLWNVDGVVYRLQKVSDYDPTKDITTKCELIKLIQGETILAQGVPANQQLNLLF